MLGVFLNSPVSSVLFSIILVIGIICQFRAGFVNALLLHPYLVGKGERLYTVVSAGFVHRRLPHLFINLLVFYAFAGHLEAILNKTTAAGNLALAVVFITGMVAGNLLSTVAHYKDFSFTSMGSSGGVIAVMFARLILSPGKALFILPLVGAVPNPVAALICLVVFIRLFYLKKELECDHVAHIGGAIAGIALAIAYNP